MLAITFLGQGFFVTSWCSTINIATMSYQYCSRIFHCNIHLRRFMFSYFTFIYGIYAISLYFIFNHHRTFIFLQISNYLLCDIFKHNLCYRQINQQPTHFRSPPHSRHWNTEPYQVSADRCEGSCNLDINSLASDNLRQYTTVTNQCKTFP